MVIEDVINFWLRIEKLSKNLRHLCLVWEIGCVWWLIFCVAVYLYTWSSSLVSRMWPFWKRSTGLVTRPWPPLLMFYISRSHKSNHPTSCWFILPQKKENLKNVGSGREIRCFPTQKGGNLQKILKNVINAQNWPIFSLQLNHLRYRCYRKGSLMWPRRICWLKPHFLLKSTLSGFENSWNLNGYTQSRHGSVQTSQSYYFKMRTPWSITPSMG